MIPALSSLGKASDQVLTRFQASAIRASSCFGTAIAILNRPNSFAIQSSNSERSLAYWAQREGLTQAVPALALRAHWRASKIAARFCRTQGSNPTITIYIQNQFSR